MGRGGIFGIGQLFSHEMERGYDVVAASFDSSDNVTWSFDQDTGEEIQLDATSNDCLFVVLFHSNRMLVISWW